MLAFTVLSLFFCLVNAAPNLDLAGPPTPERMFSLAQRHARSSLTKRNECWVDDDCPRVPNAGQSTCNATRCCDVHCNPGFTLVDGQCHQNQQASTSPSAGACPSGKRLFNGACVSAPASALSPKRQCNTDNDCTTGRGHAFATCQNGSCSVVCWQGYVFNGQYCAQASDASCQKTGCVNGPAGSHLIGQCRADGRCTAVCEPGYVFGAGADKYRCYQSSPNSCATTQCLQIVGGTSSCANGVCSYVCSDLNKVPILKNNPTRYRCENTANNPQCCGPSCTRCPSGASSYSGLGTPAPACKAGGCTYDCAVGSLKTDNAGKPYCA